MKLTKCLPLTVLLPVSAAPSGSSEPTYRMHASGVGCRCGVVAGRASMTHGSPTTTDRLSIEHALTVTRGVFPTPRNQAILGSIGDSAPATWGRRLMQRSERRLAEKEKRPIGRLQRRTIRSALPMTPLGALRFRWTDDPTFQAPPRAGVPPLIEPRRLLQITERILRDEETDEDLQIILAPESSLGGARPKASLTSTISPSRRFPEETDDYSIETSRYRRCSLTRDRGLPIKPALRAELASPSGARQVSSRISPLSVGIVCWPPR